MSRSRTTERISSSLPRVEQRILITQAKAGMVLSRTIESIDRVRLCPHGTELSDGLIQRLAARGIKRIWVTGMPVPGMSPGEWEQIARRLRQRFSRVQDVPFMKALERIVENELARRT